MAIRHAATRLKAHGLRIVAAVPDSAAKRLKLTADSVVPAPPWSSLGRQVPSSSSTLGDVLAGAGLADLDTVQRLLTAWDAVLSDCCPDLVVADFAPMAAFAARGRVPVVLTGNGYTLPPFEMLRFPLLHRQAPPAWDEGTTLAIINSAARSCEREPLQRLPQLFQGDAHLIHTFPLLDPYDTQRRENADGPLFVHEPKPKRDSADEIFVYLSAGYHQHPDILEALRPLGNRLRLYAPAMPAPWHSTLAACGARVHATPPCLNEMLPAARIIVHHGGTGVAAEALASGVPQVILSAQIEQDLTGAALERAGVARWVKTYVAGATVAPALLEEAANDPIMAQRAHELGRQHRAYAKAKGALSAFERTCMVLLAN